MVRGIIDYFKCSSFSPFSVSTSAGSLCLASLCQSIYGAAFERIFTSRCLCTLIRQCTITLSLHRCPPLCFLFVLLNSNCSLSAAHSDCYGAGPFQKGLQSLSGVGRKPDQFQTYQLFVFLFLDLFPRPWVLQLRKEASILRTGLRAAWPSLPPMCRDTFLSVHCKQCRELSEQSSALLGCRSAT